MNKRIKHAAAPLLASVILAGFTACGDANKEDKNLLGGDAICYSYCVYNDDWQLATIPVITSTALTSAHLNSVQTDADGVFTFSENSFDLSETFEYNGYHVYFLGLKIECANQNTYQSVNVQSITLDLNGEMQRMETPHFQIANGVEGIAPENYNNGALFYGGNGFVSLVHSVMPSALTPAEIGVVATKDLTIDSYVIADYFKIEQFGTEDNANVNPEHIDVKLKKDDTFVASYTLDYQSGSDDSTIIRAAQILTYTDENGKGAFISGAGEYLYLGHGEQTVIKNYIDRH